VAVGEVVCGAEAFDGRVCAEAAGDVELLGGEVVPEPVSRRAESLIVVLSGEVGD
jgi:hypothetical protein